MAHQVPEEDLILLGQQEHPSEPDLMLEVTEKYDRLQ
jgi:hypothetical protein